MSKKKFSLFKELETNIKTIDDIDNSIKITLGPTGKNGISSNMKGDITFLTSGSLLLKSLEFENSSSNVILKLLEQAATKSFSISGDGSTTTVLIACDLLKNALRFLVNGYNPILLGNGLKQISFFLLNKINEFSLPIENYKQLEGILKTSLGQKLTPNLFLLIRDCLKNIDRDGLIIVEENTTEKDEIEIVQGLELDRGFASSYFVTD